MSAAVLTKSLDEELVALVAGESDDCPACGEAVVREGRAIECPACGSRLGNRPDVAVQLRLQAG
jgi:DNA-directed RNA polymerase subunit RPC12/RpoP